MIEYYNAFISYKHAPLDSKVAADVQRSLEHFHIPAGIQKKTGKKKIERVFRDKDELPITSDLTDTISNALEKADYLIVICSPETKKSMWVKREIQYFLKNHTKSQVLTVLAAGEPEEVIPEELLSDEREIENEAGIKYTIKVPIEPLSCDYRMPLKRAHKEELPRLASAVIGCSYDELVRRQRQYKLRRMTVAFVGFSAAALAFGGYMYYSKLQIDASYRESLANQSRYLANESLKLNDESLRIDALHLALAAIPKDETDKRPVTAEASMALHRATLAYKGQKGSSIGAVWNYSSNGKIKSFRLSDDGAKLLVQDDSDNILLWDTQKHNKIKDLKYGDQRIADFKFLNNDIFVVCNPDRIIAYDAATGETKWTFKEKECLFVADCVVEYDDDTILAYSGSLSETCFYKIRISTGEKISTYKIERNGTIDSYTDFALSPDRKRIAFTNIRTAFEGNYGVYDLDTGKTRISEDLTDKSYTDISWVDNNRVVVSEIDYNQTSSSSMGGSMILINSLTKIKCVNPDDLSLYWESSFYNANITYTKGFINLPETKMIAFYSGDHCTAYDINSGVTKYDWVTGNPIIDTSDRDGDGVPIFITVEGGLGMPVSSNDSQALSYRLYFADNIRQAEVNNGVYVLSKNYNQIIYYGTSVYDEDWTGIIEDLDISSITQQYSDEKVIAFTTSYQPPYELYLIDPNKADLIAKVSIDIEGGSIGNSRILGRIKDYLYVLYGDSNGLLVYKVSLSDGKYEKIKLKGDNFRSTKDASICDDKIIYTYRDEDWKRYACIFDPESDKTQEFEIDITDTLNVAPFYSESAGIIYLSGLDDDFIVNVNDDEAERVSLPSDWSKTSCIAISDDATELAVSDEANILVMDTHGTIKSTIYCGGHKPAGFVFYNEPDIEESVLLVAFSEGSLMKYRCSTGEFVSKSDISAYEAFSDNAEFMIDQENKLLYITIDRLVDIVDLDSWLEIACVEECFGYHKGTDRFYTTSFTDSRHKQIGYFKHYTTEDLVEKAEKILQGSEMPAEMRAQYGL